MSDQHRHGDPFDTAPRWAAAIRDQIASFRKEMRGTLNIVLINQEILMTIAQDLEDEVAAETAVIASVEIVVQNLIDAVKDAGTDQTKLAAVLAAAQANKTRLGALVAANTPANAEAVASPAAPEFKG